MGSVVGRTHGAFIIARSPSFAQGTLRSSPCAPAVARAVAASAPWRCCGCCRVCVSCFRWGCLLWLLRWLLLCCGRRSLRGRFGLCRGPLRLVSCGGSGRLVAGGGRLRSRGRFCRRPLFRSVACGGWLRLGSGLRLVSGCRLLALAVVVRGGGFGVVRCLRGVVALGVEVAGCVFFFSVRKRISGKQIGRWSSFSIFFRV